MNKELAEKFISNKDKFLEITDLSYSGVAARICEIFDWDTKRITRIDQGDYQGTLVFIFAAKGYQPYRYWGTSVGYGSCDYCDTMESILGCKDPEKKSSMLWSVGLHMVQQMVVICA